MRMRLPLIVQDEALAGRAGGPLIDIFNADAEDAFLPGPVSRRVAILDFDPKTGLIDAPTPLRPASASAKRREYLVAGKRVKGRSLPEPSLARHPDFIRLSVLATVLKTLYLFESPDTLGRRVEWAFDSPQLLVVPRAGTWENAFYERESRSLQFFSFEHPERETVHTALSHDIVSHETAHAVIDGVAPDLYDAALPESLAIHEALADLTAAIAAFRTKSLRSAVLPRTGHSIERPTAFSSIAQVFGMALGRGGALRDLLNDALMPAPRDASALEPHRLSEVLSGALYEVMVRMHRHEVEVGTADGKRSLASAASWGLERAARRFQRIVLRALDYLPPGEASFADFGRAVIASDAAAHPEDDRERTWLAAEFVRRGIVAAPGDLAPIDVSGLSARDADPPRLVESAFAAHEFARANRELLGIPAGAPFEVQARQRVDRDYYMPQQATVTECLLKVSWAAQQPTPAGPAPKLRYRVGTTLALDWATGQVRARLTSDAAGAGWGEEAAERAERRTAALQAIIDADIARFDAAALGPDGEPLGDYVRGETAGDVMALRGTGRLLHVVGER